ncbi:MAG: hypothetical protein IPG61_19720 [bacterium]|nr:hypothetical protein [bacterium]
MGVGLAILVFLALVLGWTLLPFIPGWRELTRKSDAEALPVQRRSEVEVRHFAQGFRAYLDRTLKGIMERSRSEGAALTGELADGTPYLVTQGGNADADLAADERAYCTRLIVAANDLRLPADWVHAGEVYAAGNLTGGARSVYRAAMADGSLTLAAGSASLRWLHAGRALTAGEGCRLCGRVSSDASVHLEPGCGFERLNAPVITFGAAAPAPGPLGVAPDAAPLVEADIHGLVDTTGGRWLVKGDFELPAGRRLEHDLVVDGTVILREGSHLQGSLKSHGRFSAERGVTVTGSIVGQRDVAFGAGCRIGGPIVSEQALTLGAGCVVGSAAAPTTASALDIRIEQGVRCHGTVWAHRRGDVVRPPEKALDQRLDHLSRRGFRGGFIPRHRALLSSPRNGGKILTSALLVLAFWLLLFVTRGGVARLWLAIMDFWQSVAGMGGSTSMVTYKLAGLGFEVPYLGFGAGLPGNLAWLIGAGITSVVLVVSLLLPHRFLPLAYFLRIAGFFQATAQVYFHFWGGHFPYTGDGYVHGTMIAGFFLLALIPPILGFTYYLFDFSLGRKVGLTAAMMGHLVIMIPLQYFLHAWLMHHASLLVMPLLFFVAGLPLNVMMFIALFGWGFSWQDRLHDENVQRQVRVS